MPLCVVFFDATLRVRVHEASMAPGRLGGAAAVYARGMISANFTAKTKHDGGKEKRGCGSPSKAHEVLSNMSFLAGRAESVTTLDDPCSHEGSSQCLEKKGNKCGHGREIAAKSAAKGQGTSSHGNGRKEEGDEKKGKHEA